MYFYKYPRPAVTVDAILISKQNSVLLIQRSGEPFKGKWALPGGFIELHESLETACHRELEEETSLKVEKFTQFKAYGSVDRDPRGRIISVIFYSLQNVESIPVAGDDAVNAKWYPLGQLPELAFDHQQIIDEFKAEVL